MLRILVLYILVMLGINLGKPQFHSKQHMITFDQSHHQQSVSLSLQDTFRIQLPVQMGTGFSWQWQEQEDFELVAQQVERLRNQPGMAEQQLFTVCPRRQGSSKITLYYQRPWEKKTIRTFELKVDVSP